MRFSLNEEPYCYYDICKVITDIMQLHKDFSHKFDGMTEQELINLKRKQIRHICEVSLDEKTFILKKPFSHSFKRMC